MRDYSKVAPTFWTRGTGRSLRGDPDAQLVALYLMTSPHANMIGVFHCPVVYISNDTGIPLEGASKALRRVIQAGFCTVDEASDTIWVHTMASWQIGEKLKPTDNRVSGIQEEFDKIPQGVIRTGFFRAYRHAFHLVDTTKNAEGLERPSEAPSKALRSQEQEQEQEQAQEQNKRSSCAESAPPPTAPPAVPPAPSLALVGGTALPKPFIELPTNTGAPWAVYPEMVEDWKQLFPAVDVEQSLRSMRAWCDAKPARRKTERGMRAFIVGWLTKDQNEGRSPRNVENVPRGPAAQVQDVELFEQFRAAVAGQRIPADVKLATAIAKLGGLHQLGQLDRFAFDRLRPQVESLYRGAPPAPNGAANGHG